jgi:hypothetical protein
MLRFFTGERRTKVPIQNLRHSLSRLIQPLVLSTFDICLINARRQVVPDFE